VTTAFLLFAATFAAVFALGIQQLNVNAGHKGLAFATSLFITGSQLVLFKVLPGPTEALQLCAHFLGAACGVVSSMWAHPYLLRMVQSVTGQAEDGATWRAPL
jgi:hypothetical protein